MKRAKITCRQPHRMPSFLKEQTAQKAKCSCTILATHKTGSRHTRRRSNLSRLMKSHKSSARGANHSEKKCEPSNCIPPATPLRYDPHPRKSRMLARRVLLNASTCSAQKCWRSSINLWRNVTTRRRSNGPALGPKTRAMKSLRSQQK